MLFGHGDDFYNSQNEIKMNFSSNVWHGVNLEKLQEHLNEQFEKLTRYPEPDAASLKRLIARRNEIGDEHIVVTNGSVTAFYLIAQAWFLPPESSRTPLLSEHRLACSRCPGKR